MVIKSSILVPLLRFLPGSNTITDDRFIDNLMTV